MTKAQQDAFKALVAAIEEAGQESQEESRGPESQEEAGEPESREGTPQIQSEDPALAKIDRLCLELCIALLNHELGNSEYESVIISELAVLGFRDNKG